MRRAAAASVIALALLAAPAHGAVEGGLTELTGAGSCLTQNPVGTADCAPLAGVPADPTPGGDIGPPAFSADGRNAYVGTQPPDDSFDEGPGMLYALSRDPATGRLTQMTGPGSCFAEDGRAPCAKARGFDGLSSAAVTRDGRFVYVESDAAVAVFRRDPATGRLTQLSGKSGCYARLNEDGCTRVRGMYAGSMKLTPGDRQVLVSSGATIYVLRRDARTGGLRWPGKKLGCMSASSRSRCRRIPELGDLPQYTRNGRRAYAPSADDDGVVPLRSDPSTGLLSPAGDPVCARRSRGRAPRRCSSPSGGSQLLTLSPDERHLYLSDTVRDEIASFAVGRLGAVTAIPGTYGCSRSSSDPLCKDEAIGWQVEITPDGRFAYQIDGGLVLAFSRDRESGALTILPGADGCLSDQPKPPCTQFRNLHEPWRARLSPDGRQLYLGSAVGSSPPGDTLIVLARAEATAQRHP